MCNGQEGGKKFRLILVGKHLGKQLLERPRRKWDDNIMMDLREAG
jgi:hypothetical protein